MFANTKGIQFECNWVQIYVNFQEFRKTQPFLRIVILISLNNLLDAQMRTGWRMMKVFSSADAHSRGCCQPRKQQPETWQWPTQYAGLTGFHLFHLFHPLLYCCLLSMARDALKLKYTAFHSFMIITGGADKEIFVGQGHKGGKKSVPNWWPSLVNVFIAFLKKKNNTS